MSTYLQLCQKTRQETGIAGIGPTTVINQTGELKMICDWVIQAWIEIQNRHMDWRWMRVGFTLNTVTNDDSYAFSDCTDDLTSAAINRFGRWRINSEDDPPKEYLQSSGVNGETWLIFTHWDWFKRIYKIGTQNNSQPIHISIDPQDNIVLGPKPNNVYVISGDYQRGAQVLAADADVPDMPPRFHDLIVYRAMEKYALFESAQEVLIRSQLDGRRIMRQLEADQLSAMYLAPAMA